MFYFTEFDRDTIDSLRQAYRRQAVLLHPDKHEEEEAAYYTREFQQMQAEYESILSGISREEFKEAKTTYAREKDLQDMINRLMEIKGAYIELCGCWLWVSGISFIRRHQISRLGFQWSKKKQRWYWGLTMSARRKKAKYANMQQVYDRYGRLIITATADDTLQLGR